jgi:hypothetical protein
MRSKGLGESDMGQKLGQSFAGQGLSNLKISKKYPFLSTNSGIVLHIPELSNS